MKFVPEKAQAINQTSAGVETVDAEVWPEGSLEVLSQLEVDLLRSSGESGLYPLLRRCILAVLNSGTENDDAIQPLVQSWQPNVPTKSEAYYHSQDWTNGCIALSNSDMIDIWLMTGENTPIEIRP